MSDPFVGEIQVFSYDFVPNGWAICDGHTIPIVQNPALYSLIGTAYGGDGRTTFAVPNLVGHVAFSQGQGPGLANYTIGEPVGSATASVSQQQMPSHTHSMQMGDKTSTNGTAVPSASSNVAIDPSFNGFVAPPANAVFATSAIIPIGGSQPHPNAQPTLAMVYCIALVGDFPAFG
jgi:microcystin-dependent protein